MRPLALALLLAACGAAERPRGGVVTLLPAWTEAVRELGAADRIVACTAYGEPGRDVPRVPWQGADAVEPIVRLRPDLVIRQRSRAPEDPVGGALAEAGVPLLSLSSESVADVRAAILAIGAALDLEARAEAYVAEFDARLARARAAVAGKERPRVLFVFGRDAGTVANVDAAGPGSFLDELIRYAGGRNALEDIDAPYPKVRLETIVRLAPEVIIDNVPDADEDARAAWSAFPTLPAVRDGRVHAVTDRALLIPGPRLPAMVERLAELIHGGP